MADPDPETRVRMAEAAWRAGQNAHAPFSKFQVGAALLTEDGRIFTGCNVENRSYGLTICAERGAVLAAVAAGARRYRWMTLVLPGAKPPCGACLQVLSEFCDQLSMTLVDAQLMESPEWATIVRQGDETRARTVRLEELLPMQFRLDLDHSSEEE